MIRSVYFTAIVLASCLSACNTTLPAQEQQQSEVSVSLVKKSASDLKKSARTDFARGEYKDAVKAFYAVLQQNPNDHESRLGIAESYFKLGEYALATDHFQGLLSLPEYKSQALQGIGLAELQKSNISAAQEALELAVASDTSLWRSWNGLARVHDSQTDWDKAIEAYEKALEYTDRSEIIYNNMGVSYMAQERFEQAAEAFSLALNHKPNLEIASTNYRLALAMQDRYDEAVLEHDVRKEAKALNNAGYAAMVRGDYREAEKLFLRSLETNPSFYKPAYDNLQVLYHLKNKRH